MKNSEGYPDPTAGKAIKRADRPPEIAREIEKKIDAEWEEREQVLSGETDNERMLKVLALLMSVPAKVLCEKFKWKPITDENDRRSRLLQFSEAVAEEVNRICGDEMTDIRTVAEEAYKKIWGKIRGIGLTADSRR